MKDCWAVGDSNECIASWYTRNVLKASEMARVSAVLPGAAFGTFQLPQDLTFVVERGEGPYVWSTDGTRYIDYLLGSGPLVIGHAHPEVVAALKRQIRLGTTFYALNEPAIQLAERIVELVPCAESVKLVGDGSSATFFCLRLARAVTGREKVLKFEGGYHGYHDYGLQASSQPFPVRYPEPRPDSAGIPAGATSTVLVAPFNDISTTRSIVEAHAGELAAIIVEPVQRALPPKPGFLAGLRQLCDETGALLVFDEVVTGFRLAPGGAQATFGVIPDLCALGKVIGGGLSLGAVAGPRRILELTVASHTAKEQLVYISGTLNGNPLAAAAGLATLDVLGNSDSYGRLNHAGSSLRSGLIDVAVRLSVPLQILGVDSVLEPVFGRHEVSDYRGYLATDRRAAFEFSSELIRRGVLVRPASKIYVSTAHSDLVIDYTLEVAEDALRSVRDRGLIQV